jgi:hypothetical protein
MVWSSPIKNEGIIMDTETRSALLAPIENQKKSPHSPQLPSPES